MRRQPVRHRLRIGCRQLGNLCLSQAAVVNAKIIDRTLKPFAFALERSDERRRVVAATEGTAPGLTADPFAVDKQRNGRPVKRGRQMMPLAVP